MSTDKLRWIEHNDNSTLVQLQVKSYGMWYTINGTTTHSLNDVTKRVIMDNYRKSLGL